MTLRCAGWGCIADWRYSEWEDELPACVSAGMVAECGGRQPPGTGVGVKIGHGPLERMGINLKQDTLLG